MISTQFIKSKNAMIDEDIVTARIVNMQSMEFDEWCEHLADGSTVTAADVSAVMKQIEKRLPTILGFNTKVICSPEGLTFRPKVSGSITQSELKAKLVARKAAETDPEKAAAIDVDRALTTSDLTISDCTVSIVVDLPKSWSTAFMQKAKLKRVTKTLTDTAESTDDAGEGGSENTGGDETQGGQQTGGSTESGGSGSGSGSGDNGGGSDSGDNGSGSGGGDNGGGDGGDGLTND
jgi:hypothetical protein